MEIVGGGLRQRGVIKQYFRVVDYLYQNVGNRYGNFEEVFQIK